MTTWHPAYIGLGSNLHGPREQVAAALERLAELPLTRVFARSPLYGSTPQGPVAQPDFVNAVAGVLTQLDVDPFFQALRALERALGRTPPRERWGPRRIDLDLLAFSRESRETAELVLPHPGLGDRNFVLLPLCDVAPGLDLPKLGLVEDLARGTPREGLWRLSD